MASRRRFEAGHDLHEPYLSRNLAYRARSGLGLLLGLGLGLSLNLAYGVQRLRHALQKVLSFFALI